MARELKKLEFMVLVWGLQEGTGDLEAMKDYYV